MKKKNIFLTILGIMLSLVFITPILILLVNSFKAQKEIMMNIIGFPESLNFNNYIQAWDKLDFVQSFTNSLVITVVSTVLLILLPSAAAWKLVRTKSRLSTIIFLIFSAAMLIPFQCVMLPLVRFMDQMGLMNRLGLIFMYVGFGGSMSMMLFHGFIKNIPMELEEAAALDGAGQIYIFFRVILPLLKNISVTVAILNVMWIWNDFLLPSLVINKNGWQTLPLKTYLFFGQYSRRWDLATAALVMIIIPVIIFYLICQKQIMQGVTEGAVK